MESKIFITHDIKCAVNASTAGKGDCDCGAVEQAEKQEHQFKYTPYGLRAEESGKLSIGELPRKEWVGLNWDDMPEEYAGNRSFLDGAKWAEARLKEKNT